MALEKKIIKRDNYFDDMHTQACIFRVFTLKSLSNTPV